jgi:hypothetical protein
MGPQTDLIEHHRHHRDRVAARPGPLRVKLLGHLPHLLEQLGCLAVSSSTFARSMSRTFGSGMELIPPCPGGRPMRRRGPHSVCVVGNSPGAAWLLTEQDVRPSAHRSRLLVPRTGRSSIRVIPQVGHHSPGPSTATRSDHPATGRRWGPPPSARYVAANARRPYFARVCAMAGGAAVIGTVGTERFRGGPSRDCTHRPLAYGSWGALFTQVKSPFASRHGAVRGDHGGHTVGHRPPGPTDPGTLDESPRLAAGPRP